MQHSIKKVDFQGIEVRIIQVDGVAYIPGEDIGKMLGYEEPRDSVSKIFERHRDELELHSSTVKLTVEGVGLRKTRCYNETGAYLIAMFARTSKAREVRQWLAGLPKKIREFHSINEQEMKRIAEEAYRRGHLDGYQYAIEYELEDEEEESEAEKALREVGWFSDRSSRESSGQPVDMARLMKAAQAGFDLACLHLHPKTLDSLLLAWTYDRGPLRAAFDNGLPVGTVKEVFQIFLRIGLPRHTEYKEAIWWDKDRHFVNESRYSYGAQTVLTRIYRLMMRVKAAIGENVTEEKVFKELESNRPDWLLLTRYQVHIRSSVFSGTEARMSLQALGDEIFWPVRKYVYPRTKRSERTIAIPRILFYDRYFVCGERMFLMVQLDEEAAKIHFLLKNYPREEAQEIIRMLEQGVQKKAH